MIFTKYVHFYLLMQCHKDQYEKPVDVYVMALRSQDYSLNIFSF